MKKGMAVIAVFALAIVVASCDSQTNSETEAHAEENLHNRVTWLAEIDSLEGVVYSDSVLLEDDATGELLRNYLSYSEVFVGDAEKTPMFLYKAAALSRAIGLPAKALKLYDRILTDYPQWEKASETAFLVAFTYDADLNEPDRAKEAYQEVVDRYPGGTWAIQAQERLKTVGMSDQELIEMFEAKSQGTPAS